MAFEDNVLELPFFSEKECDDLLPWCHNVEKSLIEQGFKDHKEHDSLGDVVTTNNYFRYNFFREHPGYADRFADFLFQVNKDLEWPVVVQSWVNIYHKGQGIDWHNHQGLMGKSFSANIFLDGPTEPGIIYKPFREDEYVRKNKKGFIHMFPCELYHMVPPVDKDRITIGITIHSYHAVGKSLMNQLAFNSRIYQDSIILTKEHHEYAGDNKTVTNAKGKVQSHST